MSSFNNDGKNKEPEKACEKDEKDEPPRKSSGGMFSRMKNRVTGKTESESDDDY